MDNEVNQVKKKTLVPLIIFLLGICLVSLIVYKTDAHEKEQRHITAQLNVQPHKSVLSSSLPGRSQKGSAIPAVIISFQQVLK